MDFNYYSTVNGNSIHLTNHEDLKKMLLKAMEYRLDYLENGLRHELLIDPVYCISFDIRSLDGWHQIKPHKKSVEDIIKVLGTKDLDVFDDKSRMMSFQLEFNSFMKSVESTDTYSEDYTNLQIRPYLITFESGGKNFMIDSITQEREGTVNLTFIFDNSEGFPIRQVKSVVSSFDQYNEGVEIEIIKEIQSDSILSNRNGEIRYVPHIEMAGEDRETITAHPAGTTEDSNSLYYATSDKDPEMDGEDLHALHFEYDFEDDSEETEERVDKLRENSVPVLAGGIEFIKLNFQKSRLKDLVDLENADSNWLPLKKYIFVPEAIKLSTYVAKDMDDAFEIVGEFHGEKFETIMENIRSGETERAKIVEVIQSVIVFKISKALWENESDMIPVTIITKYQNDFSEDYGFYY